MLSYGESLILGLLMGAIGYGISLIGLWLIGCILALGGMALIFRAVALYDDPPR